MTDKKRKKNRTKAEKNLTDDYAFSEELDSSLPPLDGEEAEFPEEPANVKSGKKSKKKSGKAPKKKGVLHRIKVFFIVFIVIALLLTGAAAYGGYYVSNLGTTLPNLYIDDVFVGGMDKEGVDNALMSSGWDDKCADVLIVKLPAEVSFTVKYLDAGMRTTREDAVKLAVEYGHSINWFKNLYEYAMNHITPAKLKTRDSHEMNEKYLLDCIRQGSDAFKAATEDKGYTIDKERSLLCMVKGAGQVALDEDALLTAIKEALLADKTELSFETLKGDMKKPDFQALHDKLAAEPVEAYFTEKFEVVDEIDGCWFEVNDAQKLWDSTKALDAVEIPIELTYPEVTGDSLRALLYRDKLGEKTTYFPNSIENRISNINLAAEKLNGLILLPGETFSYNEVIGQRTEEAGFLPAGAYENGQVVEEVGGGICQVSSTLYCATMYAQMETVARTSHYFRVDYLPLGEDATVSWPKPDFKFKNCREYPVKIVAECNSEERYITIEIWGTDVDGSYVELRHDTYTRFDATYTDVAIGYYVIGFRDVYDADGNLINTIQEPAGDYFFHEEEIQWPEYTEEEVPDE